MNGLVCSVVGYCVSADAVEGFGELERGDEVEFEVSLEAVVEVLGG